MTKPKSLPLWRVRVCLSGSVIHLVSQTEPIVHIRDGHVADVCMALVTGTIDGDDDDIIGDTIGFIDWPEVVAVTWRAATLKAQ